MSKRIAVLVGSLRKESFNRKIANVLITLPARSLTFTLIEIGDLPLYNEDIDGECPPESYSRFRQHVAKCVGAIFISPEYNRSVPAVLKNAIDVGSRPYGNNVWNNMPAAVITSSPGSMGGVGANRVIRQSLTVLNMIALSQPEAYLGGIDKAFDINGEPNEKIKTFLQHFIDAYADLVSKLTQ